MDYGGVGKQLGQSEGVSQRGSVRGGQSEGGDGDGSEGGRGGVRLGFLHC